MRMIGEIQGESAARTFSDYLYAQGIANEIERAAAGNWVVWVKSEDDCPRAVELLGAFAANPADPRFANAAQEAAMLRRREDEDQASYERRVRNARKFFPSLKGHRFGPLTYALIFICVVVFVITKFGTNFEPVDALWFSKFRGLGPFWERLLHVPELRDGQFWRLLTPIFIHMGFVHILFNMLWIAELGSQIEGRQSTGLLARLVIITGIGSNIVQFVATGRPNFGGMSGVVYGLIGYMWIRGRLDPSCGLGLSQETIIMSVIWFAVCFTGWVGPIANGAHAGGLIIGMLWGWLAARRAIR